MNVLLNPQLEKFVADEVKSGHFTSAEEVVEAGLARLMLDHGSEDFDAELTATIEEAEDQLDRGEGMALDDAFGRLRKKHFGV